MYTVQINDDVWWLFITKNKWGEENRNKSIEIDN
jgi:hypothetical protein